MRTVAPDRDRSLRISFTTRACCGSRPTMGSSMITTSGFMQQGRQQGHALACAMGESLDGLVQAGFEVEPFDELPGIGLTPVPNRFERDGDGPGVAGTELGVPEQGVHRQPEHGDQDENGPGKHGGSRQGDGRFNPCPTLSRLGSRPGLAARRASSLKPPFRAIE